MATVYGVSVAIADGVAIVRFDRGQRLNALTFPLIEDLTRTAETLALDPQVRAVILRGADSCFSSGMDLHEQGPSSPVRGPLNEARIAMTKGQRLCRAWEELPQPTIAAIEGPCVGAGVALALACDWRVMGAESYLSAPELLVGINLGWQAVPRLVNLVGPARAKEIAILCERMSAEQALAWGLASRCAAKGGALAEASNLAQRVAQMPTVATRMVKQAANVAANALNSAVSIMDADQALLCVRSEDFAEGVAAFSEGRTPRFSGQ